MSFSVRDGITPGLARAAAALKDRQRVLGATGLQLDTGLLRKHARSIETGTGRVLYAAVQQLGSAKGGGRGAGLPARLCFPFTGHGAMTALAAEKVRKVAFAKLVRLLRS